MLCHWQRNFRGFDKPRRTPGSPGNALQRTRPYYPTVPQLVEFEGRFIRCFIRRANNSQMSTDPSAFISHLGSALRIAMKAVANPALRRKTNYYSERTQHNSIAVRVVRGSQNRSE